MLKVNEIFGPTIQGEGASVGQQVIFLRLANCNLHCIWCDTPYTWNWEGTTFSHSKKYCKENEVHLLSEEEIYSQTCSLAKEHESVNSLVISGGEPFLQHKQLLPLIQKLKEEGWWIEVETNSTIIPNNEVSDLVDQFNCSPKLSNSGDSEKLRIRPKALSYFAHCKKSTFKFVVASEKDMDEILKIVYQYNLKRVYLMPLGMTRDELNKTRDTTKKMCEKHNFFFSDRLHVVKFNGVRGV